MLLSAAGYRCMPWKNGQGTTREIAREESFEGEDFLWRLSIADVAASGEFSLFPGYQRTISLIEGAGMRLDFAEAPGALIERRFEPFDFSGDWHCRCTLLSGPVQDFNLMVSRDRLRATTEVIALGGAGCRREIDSGWLLVYCAVGGLTAGGVAAEAGDTVKLGPGRHEIRGGYGIALVMALHMLRGR